MAKNTIQFDAQLDPHQLISQLQKIQQSVKGAFSGRSGYEFSNTLSKAEIAAEKLNKALRAGYTNEADAKRLLGAYGDFETQIRHLNQMLSDKAKPNLFTSVDEQIKKLNEDIEKSKKEITNLKNVLGEKFKSGSKSFDKVVGRLSEDTSEAKYQELLQQRRADYLKSRKDPSLYTTSELGKVFPNQPSTRIEGIRATEFKQVAGEVLKNVIAQGLTANDFATQIANSSKFAGKNITIGGESLKSTEGINKLENAFIQLIAKLTNITEKATREREANYQNFLNTAGGQRNGMVSTSRYAEIISRPEFVNTQNLMAIQRGSISNSNAQIQQLEGVRTSELDTYNQRLSQAISEQNAFGQSLAAATSNARQQAQALKNVNNTFAQMTNRIAMFFTFNNVLNMIQNTIRSTFNELKEIDKAFASIAMVTNKTISELWTTYGDYAEIANKLGQSTKSAIQASALFYQQGLNTSEALTLTEDTMKLATLSGQDFTEATKQMTAAIRGFNLEMNEGSHVTDVYSELAANAAADVHGIAYAMSKTASIASSAGMDFENTSAFLAKMIETTQEAPENIGTAMKSIIARFTELKTNVAGTTDSEFDDLDYNKVDKALKSVGVSIKDAYGQFRNLDDVFLELAGKWSSLDRNTQRYIATVAAGSRQQSRFLALMEDYDRTLELVEVAQEANGRSSEQFAKNAESLEFKINRLKNTWEQFRINIVDASFFKGALDVLNSFVDKIKDTNLPALLFVGLAGGTLVKRTIDSLITQFNTASIEFRKLGNKFGQQISAGIIQGAKGIGNKIYGEKIAELQQQIQSGQSALLSQTGASSSARQLKDYQQAYNTSTGKNLAQLKAEVDEYNRLSATLNKTSTETQRLAELEDYLTKITGAVNGDISTLTGLFNSLSTEEKEQLANLLNLQIQLDTTGRKFNAVAAGAQAMISTFGQLASSAVVTGIATGGDFDAIFNSTLLMGATAGVNVLAKSASHLATAMSAAEGGLAASLAAAGGELAVIAPEILGVAAAVGIALIAIKAISLAVDNYKEKTKTITEKIKEQKEVVDKLTSAYSNQAQAAKEAHNEYKDAKSLKEEYEKLSAEVNKTTEQQEKYGEIVEQIKDEFPSIVESYNEITGELIVHNELWDELIDRKKQFLNLQSQEAITDAIALAEAEKEQGRLEGQQQADYKNFIANGGQFTSGDLNALSRYADKGEKTTTQKAIEAFLTTLPLTSGVTGTALAIDENDRQQYKKLSEELYTNFSNVIGELDLQIDLQDGIIQGKDLNSLIEAINSIRSGEGSERLNNTAKLIYDYLKNDLSNIISYGSIEADDKAIGAIYSIVQGQFGDNALLRTAVEQKYKEIKIPNRTILPSEVKGFYSEEEYESLSNEEKEETLQYAYKAKKITEILSKSFEDLTDREIEAINDFTTDVKSLSQEDLKAKGDELLSTLPNNVLAYGREYLDDYSKQLTDLQNQLLGVGFNTDFVGQGSFNQLKAFWNNYQSIVDAHPDKPEIGSSYAKTISNFILDESLNPDDFFSIINSFDWTKADLNNYETSFMTNFVKMCEETGIEGGEEIYKRLIEKLRQIDVVDLVLSSAAEVDKYVEDYKASREKVYGEKDSLLSAITQQQTQGYISLDNLQKLEKSFKELGLSTKDFITYSNGQILLDAQKLEDYYLQSATKSREVLVSQIDTIIVEQKTLDKKRLELIASLGNLTEQEREKTLKEISQIEFEIEALSGAIDEAKIQLENDPSNQYKNDYFTSKTTSVEDLNQKLKELQKSVDDAQKKLNEALYGAEYGKNKLDYLYNYTTNLDRLTYASKKAKEALDDLKETDDPKQLFDTYLTNTHAEVVTRNAENEVIKQSIDNYRQVLESTLAEKIAEINSSGERNISTNISDYFTEYGDRLNVNFGALNAAQLPDDVSQYVESTVEQINKLLDQTEQNTDAIKAKEKELLEYKKKIRSDYIKLEDEVINTLKEKYEEEIKDTEDKNKALEDADNEYLDALEKAIKKQRELRDQANQYDDLAKKEARLALMERDTSGARAADAIKLQEEIEKDRTKLLDDSVDRMIDELKDMYELQKETREAEVEYQKAVLDNAALVQEANAIINSWTGSEDALAWFYNNTSKLDEMSVAKLEEQTDTWKELYNAKDIYEAAAQSDFESALDFTTDEVQKIVSATSEALTTEADRSLGEITEKVKKAIEDAEDALQKAINSLNKENPSNRDLLVATDDSVPDIEGITIEKYKDTKIPVDKPEYGTNRGSFGWSDNKNTLTTINSSADAYLYHSDMYDAVSKYVSAHQVDFSKFTPKSNLPQYFGNSGDTSIEINLNIENISDDYDVDRMIDRFKQDIVNSYQSTGSNVILRNK